MIRKLSSHIAVALFSAFFTCLLFRFIAQPAAAPAADAIAKAVSVNNTNAGFAGYNVSPNKTTAAIIDAPDFRIVAKSSTASVVNIAALNANGYQVSSGSGVILSGDGYIMTNNHVIEDGSRYEVTFYDKRKLFARRIGHDPTTDLALIKVETEGLQPIVFGNSDAVEVGEWVLAVGNPFNLSSTVTAGIVSAKARSIQILSGNYAVESFIQTDAVVNPGNSGGALINNKGELIGINTAIMSESGGYEGYSFAIPSNLVRKVVNDIKEYGYVQRAILGVGIQEVSDEMAAKLALSAVSGVYINNITSGSSAQQADLRVGDVIVAINGVQTGSVPELQEQIALFRPGDRVSIEFFREGKRQNKERITLKSLQSNNSSN